MSWSRSAPIQDVAYWDRLRRSRTCSNETAYALSSFLDRSDSSVTSAAADEAVLCMEQRLLCELDGVRFGADDDGLAQPPMAYLLR